MWVHWQAIVRDSMSGRAVLAMKSRGQDSLIVNTDETFARKLEIRESPGEASGPFLSVQFGRLSGRRKP
jgi:hypothetical protein